MVEDPVGDMLARLRNAAAAQKLSVTLPHSGILEDIAETLVKAGYVEAADVEEDNNKQLIIDLAYHEDGTPQISHMERLSRPARRSYVGVGDIPDVRNGFGDVVLSTPEGVLTGEKARQQHVGGEILFEIW